MDFDFVFTNHFASRETPVCTVFVRTAICISSYTL